MSHDQFEMYQKFQYPQATVTIIGIENKFHRLRRWSGDISLFMFLSHNGNKADGGFWAARSW